MTYNELAAEVAALGFESEIENKPALLFCANRALNSIAALSPSFASITLIQRVIPPLSLIEEINYVPRNEITVPLKGATFSFKFSGAGTVTLKERHRVSPIFLSTPYTEVRRFLPDREGELILSGDISFKLKDVACFEHVCGTAESDIPVISPFRTYDMNKHTSNFFGFTGLPTDENGNTLQGAQLQGDTLLVPSDYEGEIRLIYQRMPQRINADAPNAKIDLSAALSHLLPLLTAAYLWLDDDAAKAQFYMQLYMEGMRDIRMKRPSRIEADFSDVHHWA